MSCKMSVNGQWTINGQHTDNRTYYTQKHIAFAANGWWRIVTCSQEFSVLDITVSKLAWANHRGSWRTLCISDMLLHASRWLGSKGTMPLWFNHFQLQVPSTILDLTTIYKDPSSLPNFNIIKQCIPQLLTTQQILHTRQSEWGRGAGRRGMRRISGHLFQRAELTELYKIWIRHGPIVGAPSVCFRFQIHCFVSKPENLKGQT